MIKNFNLSPHNLDNFISKLKALDLENVRYVATVIEKKTSRSIEANRRLWALYTDLGDHIGEHPDKVHELMKYKFLRSHDLINMEHVEIMKSTTKLTTSEMADFQSRIEQWAAEIGFFFNE